MHREPHDLVHHTYTACIRAIRNGQTIRKMDAYFGSAMRIQATRGRFKALYTIRDTPCIEIAQKEDISHKIAQEEAMIIARHLPWFDRVVLALYLEGHNLKQIARESGIPANTLYQSVYKSKQRIRHAIRQKRR